MNVNRKYLTGNEYELILGEREEYVEESVSTCVFPLKQGTWPHENLSRKIM